MCTAVSYKTKDHYFGRNLDLEYSYNEEVVITPRNYPFSFRKMPAIACHYAMIGIATVANNYPLYYEATNECGLSMAGLNFPGNAFYFPVDSQNDNLAPFELIPWMLSQCNCIEQVTEKLEYLNICDVPFSNQFPLSPLHWMISDANKSLVLEQTKDGLHWYDNSVGILTNNPPFPYHQHNLQNYMHLTTGDQQNNLRFSMHAQGYSRGMGAIGLPGDFSSASRFIKAAFVKNHSVSGESEESSVNQYFRILDSVAMPRGCVDVHGKHEITAYSSCCNTDKGIYYYKTYENSQISAVNMFHEDLNSSDLLVFPLVLSPQFKSIN